jgi:hypothetical protein
MSQNLQFIAQNWEKKVAVNEIENNLIY